MAKIMLVEDDNNLRQIYQDRLAAEGYQIITASDGEAALALAVKERPDLIIADIMMPKVSGFDMLDILRSTPETKDCRIVMMTALSQAEDRSRAEKLGADKYLVKSQVTLEDLANVAAEILGQQASGNATPAAAPATNPAPAAPTPVVEPAAVVTPPAASATPAAPTTPAPAPEPAAPAVTSVPVTTPPANTATPLAPTTDGPKDDFIASNPTLSDSANPAPAAPATPAAPNDPTAKVAAAVDGLLKETEHPDNAKSSYVSTNSGENATQSMSHTKVIEPLSPDPTTQAPDLNELLAKEAEHNSAPPAVNSVIKPTSPDTGSATPTAPATDAPKPAPAGDTTL